MIKLYFPIAPVPKGRPRLGRRGNVYTPQRTADFEEQIKHFATLQMHKNGHEPLIGPLTVRSFFFLKKPKKPKCDYPIGQPDGDNLLKAIYDSLNGIVWEDDAQICDGSFRKLYSVNPSISVFVEPGIQ